MFESIFGNKKWFQSLTAWGTIAYATGAALVTSICDPSIDILGSDLCSTLGQGLQAIGSVMVVLGLRRAATAPR